MNASNTYVVVGSWPFPLDMLRHDGSRAATPEDQAKIDRLSGEHAPDAASLRESVEIALVQDADNARLRPNAARWESFGWSVPGDAMHAFEKRWREEERAAAAEARARDAAPAMLKALNAAERALSGAPGAPTPDEALAAVRAALSEAEGDGRRKH